MELFKTVMTKVKQTKRIKKLPSCSVPRLKFNTDYKKSFENLTEMTTSKLAVPAANFAAYNPTIIFFGERDKILCYDIEMNK